MAHLVTSDDDYRDLTYDDAYRSYLITRTDSPRRAGVHPRRALRRVNGFFKNIIEAIANSKLRRMERELELRGIRYDLEKDNWVSRK
jgi:hypothetical protein